MEGIIVLLLVVFLIWLLIAPIAAMVRSGEAARDAREARSQVKDLLRRIKELENEVRQPARESTPPESAEDAALKDTLKSLWKEEERVRASEAPAPPPLPVNLPRRKLVDYGEPAVFPPPMPPAVKPAAPQEPFSLERFMGVKLFAWLGGVAMFFGVIFFVKYAFENNLIPPSVRIALGFVTGTALLIGGLATHRLPKYKVLAQAFCATGVVILYGVSFAAHAVYHFAAFGTLPTFALMAVITVAAFLTAVRLNALVVAVLGMLGGFLTPVLLSTGQDNVFGLFGYIALLDLGLLALSRHSNWRFLTAAAAAGTLLMQAGWHAKFFSAGRYFEGTHTLIPMGILLLFIAMFLAAAWIAWRRKETDWFTSVSLIALAAMAFGFSFIMLGFHQVAERQFLLYGFVFLVNLAVILLAVIDPRMVIVRGLAAMLTFSHLAAWSVSWLTTGNLLETLAVYLVFGALHSASPVLLGRWLRGGESSVLTKAGPWFGPFALVILSLYQVPLPDPTPVFVVALLMSALLAGLALTGRQGFLVLAALLATLAVEGAWHTLHFHADAPSAALPWYLLFYLLFLGFPFAFRKACSGLSQPWIAAALSGVGQFLLVHDLVKQSFPGIAPGLIPAAFAVPSLISLAVVARSAPDEHRQSRMAWFGGVALLFITLVFPIQFDRQWLTVSWALEGAALLWLFRRVPHPGLQLTGLALLAIAFIRLSINPAVFAEYPRGGTAILNWHLYTYGIVAAAHFVGGWWFTDPENRLAPLKPRGILFALGGILLFLLLNIEIADYFTAPGERFITFRFGGNFARDMTYSIAWGLFSLGLLGMGIWKKSTHARFAAIGLLVVTLLKVFLYDLAAIESVFRIGALIGVAVIAFIASFLYQRFLSRSEPS